MKITIPEYYPRFSCVGGACEDTCCAGWEVVVDPASARRFQETAGELGERLRKELAEENGEYSFRLTDCGRCPFLNDNNLCDIQSALGEEALCRTCRMFPRFEEEFGDLREMGLSLSCPEAARIILQQKDRPLFLRQETDEPVSRPNDLDPYYYDCIFAARERMFQLVFNREFPLNLRGALLLEFGAKLQKTVKRNNYRKAETLTDRFFRREALQKTAEKLTKKPLSSPLPRQLLLLREQLEFLGRQLPHRFQNASPNQGVLASEGEQFLFYLLYRYFLKGLYDKELYHKIAFAVFSLAAVQSLLPGNASFEEKRGLFTLYSKELEHSQENMETLQALFQKSRLFSRKNLIAALLAT